MFSIRSRLVSLLQPWLQPDPDLELKLGFLRSSGSARNLCFDISALNQAIGESSSLCFEDVRVENLSVRVSLCSVAAFTVEMQGVFIRLTARELSDESRLRQMRSLEIDRRAKEKKELLSILDPEGVALHNAVESISAITSARNSLTASLVSVLLKHLRVQMHDIHLEVQLSIRDDLCAFSKIKELSLDTSNLGNSCLLKGLVGALFVPNKLCFLDLHASDWEIGLKREGNANCIFSSTDLTSCIKLKDLQLLDLGFRAPQLHFTFSPSDLPFLLVFDGMSSKEVKHARNGRELWNIAANRIGYLVSNHRLSLHNVVDLVCLWQRHVRAYALLLSIVEYSAQDIFKNSAIRMSRDKTFLALVKQQWNVVSEIERELPVQALAQSRRIARYKAELHVESTARSSSGPLIKVQWMISRKICSVLAFLWKAIRFILQSITHFFFVRGICNQRLEADDQSGLFSENSCSRYSLNFRKISITMSPQNVVHRPVRGKSESHIGCRKEISADSMVVVWSEPAPQSLDLEEVNTSSDKSAGNGWFFHLGGYLEEMWSNWKQTRRNFKGMEGQHLKNPFLLCEINGFLVDPCPHRTHYGLWKFSLSMGKLNFDLGFSSVMSVALLLMQIHHTLSSDASYESAGVISDSPDIIEELKEFNWEDCYKVYENRIKLAMLRLIPEKSVELGVVIAGPNFRLSLKEEGLLGPKEKYTSNNVIQGHGDICIAFDLKNIKFVMWPTYKDNLRAFSKDPTSDGDKVKYPRLKKARLLDILKTDVSINCDSQRGIGHDYCLMIKAFGCYLEDLEENQRSEVFEIKSVGIHSFSCREGFHSLMTTATALSMSLCGMTAGVTVFLLMDEFLVFFQVVQQILLAVSYAFTTLDSRSGLRFQRAVTKNNTSSREDRDGLDRAVKARSSTFILNSTHMIFDMTFELNSLDIVMHSSRKNQFLQNYLKVYGDSSKKKLNVLDVPEYGIKIGIKNPHVQISWEEGHATVLINLLGMKCLLFNMYGTSSLLEDSPNCLYDFSLFDCIFTLWAGSNLIVSSSERMDTAAEGSSTVLNEGLNAKSCGSDRNFRHHEFLIRISLGEIFLGESRFKNLLSEAHQPNKHLSELSIGGEFCTISWTLQNEKQYIGLVYVSYGSNKLSLTVILGKYIMNLLWQGGRVVLQTTTFAMYVRCFSAYFLFIATLSAEQISSGRKTEEEILNPMNNLSRERIESTISLSSLAEAGHTPLNSRWKMLEALQIKLSQMSFVLLLADGSDGVWELVLDIDFYLNLELTNSRRKLLFDLSRIAIFSECHHDSYVEVEQTTVETVPPIFSDASSSSSPTILKKSPVENELAVIFSNNKNYILKHLAASVLVEKVVTGDEMGPMWFKNDWVGTGSITGLDVSISLSEIEMLMLLIASLSGFLNGETAGNSEQRLWSVDQHDNGSKDAIPDGAIVAIQDLHQHMYIAVEGAESKYQLIGAVHYSLVGERALFKVKYCNRKRWGSQSSWFTLISLHAKSDSGEPLLLNCRPGSDFVDISSDDDKGRALWRTVSYKPESYEADSDLETYNPSSKYTFFLVNKKCDRGVAFVDGVLEFSSKPGNPMKVKLFNDSYLASSISRLDMPFAQATNPPCINVTIDKVTLTIVHKLSDANDMFPLLRVCIENNQFIVQVRSSKVRHISRFTAAILHFDAQRNLWREIIQPVEMYFFYRTKFTSRGLEIIPQAVPDRFYFGVKQVDIFLTELSLDILLFIVGELNLAGPFTVRRSMIFANYCKVENRSGLSLRCHFNDNQYTTIAKKQSASIFLRRMTVASRDPKTSSSVSVQLSALGELSTSPIHVSLLNDRVLAWRTRVVSSRDKRTYPGPFVVVDISKKSKDGLSVVVSPLLRIHNETGFSMELRFRRPQQKEADFASVMLRSQDMIDDSMAALNAINSTVGSKKAFISLSLGNFLFSIRPNSPEDFGYTGKSDSIGWSEDLKGGKAVLLSGLYDKLNYKFRKAFGVESVKYSLSTVHCSINAEGAYVTDLHFLIQTVGRDVPVIHPDDFGDSPEIRTSPVALQEQKEIYLLPTVRVSNFLQSEIYVLLTETPPDVSSLEGAKSIGKQATIPNGSSAYLYGNPAMMYFTVTLTALSSKCKPVNSGDWVKKLSKQKQDVHSLDIDLDFGAGKYYASLRLSRGDRGMLEASIFTPYTLQNDGDLTLFCFASNQKTLSREEANKFGSNLSPELGSFLPPKSKKSWFLKSNKIQVKLSEEKSSTELLDLDALSGFTEVCLESHDVAGVNHISILGVSLKPYQNGVPVPSQIVLMAPRYVISNESPEAVSVRQCYLEDDVDDVMAVNSKQKVALLVRTGTNKKGESNFFDSLLRKHRYSSNDSLIFIQFRLNEVGWGWSGPICIASLGRFFLKFRRSLDTLGLQSDPAIGQEKAMTEFAVVHVVEESSTLVLKYHRRPNISLPYRIENSLRDASLTFYQKDSLQPDTLGSGKAIDYVWDDLTLPHKLVMQITNMNLLREINMDKVCAWRPLFKVRQQRGLALDLPVDMKQGAQRRTKDETLGLERLKLGYEVYADGPTRVLRISEFHGRQEKRNLIVPCSRIQLRVSFFSIHLMENKNQDQDPNESTCYSPIIVARLGNISLDSVFTDQNNYNQIRIQSLIVDEKWTGAPFSAMLRRNQLDYSSTNENVLQIVFVVLSTNSNVKQVQFFSIILQPVDLNIDEETLMRLVPFWRTSLSDSNTRSRQFYFRHFEIHPIKIGASFLPGSSDSNYSSSQETLRSLLHSVIKIPTVKNMGVELNGILVTHALVTVRELLIKCAQHYSWYGTRAVYIAKGSPLLPPAFASIFDDSAFSSLDVFFDPSSGVVNLPGLTLGMFKFISKCIDKKGFSGTKRYFGDLGKTVKTAGSNVLFAAVTEISDCVLRGAEANGFNGMLKGFHQGILKLAMEPSLLGTAVMEGGPDRKIKLDQSPGADELYIEGYLQAMLDSVYQQEYLRVRVIDNQVILKNLPPSNSLINEIMDRVKGFLISKALLKGELSTSSHPLRYLRGENEWKIGPTILTLWEHLFVSFAIRTLRKQVFKFMVDMKLKGIVQRKGNDDKSIVPTSSSSDEKQTVKLNMKRGVRKFVLSGIVAYIDGRLCRCIPNAIARRIVSGFLLSLLEKKDGE
ncbi:hypothetical protein GIB67_005389 [Kingdonia uniflora]|uniref:Vacuolar protein sorting-associated protein 13 VPS13 adaptor binding domain-containing protein n=1 Tax=Kingdonia uniflora TaxID=39325 RepID=A0A7J7NH98_9MAGN|nr:hypothetical protein GIB67_005389 [Kingdonia uniflora]